MFSRAFRPVIDKEERQEIKGLLSVFFVIILVSTAHALVDLRLFRISDSSTYIPSNATNAIVGIFSALGIIVGVLVWLRRVARDPFWTVTSMVGVYIVACYIIGIIGSQYAGLRVVTGPQYLRILSVITAAVNRATLRPAKTW